MGTSEAGTKFPAQTLFAMPRNRPHHQLSKTEQQTEKNHVWKNKKRTKWSFCDETYIYAIDEVTMIMMGFSFSFIATHIHIFNILANWGIIGWLKRIKVHWARIAWDPWTGLDCSSQTAGHLTLMFWFGMGVQQDVPFIRLNTSSPGRQALSPLCPLPTLGWHSRIGTAPGGHQNQTSSGKKNNYQCQGLHFSTWGVPITAGL